MRGLDDDGEGPEPGDWIICPDCEGDGSHVHEDLSVPDEDMLADDEAMEAYWSGGYDVRCRRCQGAGKVREGETVSLRRGASGQPFERCGVLHNEAGEPLEAYHGQ